MMKSLLVFGRGSFLASIDDLGIQFDALTQGTPASFFCYGAHGLIFIAVHAASLAVQPGKINVSI